MIEVYRLRVVGEFIGKKELPDVLVEEFHLDKKKAFKNRKKWKKHYDIKYNIDRWIPIDIIHVYN